MTTQITSTLSESTPKSVIKPNYSRALWLLWLTVAMLSLSIFGAMLDRIWHAVYEFEDFFSPPHIIIYTFSTIAALIVMWMVFTTPIRRAFGKGLNVRILPFRVPGALVILGGGLAMLGFAGLVLDNFWHSNFGLDETGWSFPHAMLSWTILLVMMGLLSSRLALQEQKRLRWFMLLFFIFLVVLFSAAPFMGPFFNNRTPEMLALVTYMPVLANQEDFMHTYRIYQTWNMNRTSPILLLLAPIWLGAVWGFVRRINSRWWFLFLIVVVWWMLDNDTNNVKAVAQFIPQIAENPANAAPLPVVFPTMVFLLLSRLKRIPETWNYVACALLFNVIIWGVYNTSSMAGVTLLLGTPLVLIGKYMGERGADAVKTPVSWQDVAPVMGIALIVPIMTGCIDLILRTITP